MNDRIQPALDALLAYLGDDYVARAPETVGLGQYPDGEAAYDGWLSVCIALMSDPEFVIY